MDLTSIPQADLEQIFDIALTALDLTPKILQQELGIDREENSRLMELIETIVTNE